MALGKLQLRFPGGNLLSTVGKRDHHGLPPQNVHARLPAERGCSAGSLIFSIKTHQLLSLVQLKQKFLSLFAWRLRLCNRGLKNGKEGPKMSAKIKLIALLTMGAGMVMFIGCTHFDYDGPPKSIGGE